MLSSNDYNHLYLIYLFILFHFINKYYFSLINLNNVLFNNLICIASTVNSIGGICGETH